MKKLALSLIGALSMLLLGGSALAQTIHVRLTVPVRFQRGQQDPAGGRIRTALRGSARQPGDARDLPHGWNGSRCTSMPPISNRRAPRAKPRSSSGTTGTIYFLSQLWTAGTRAGWEFPKTRAEISEAKNAAARKSPWPPKTKDPRDCSKPGETATSKEGKPASLVSPLFVSRWSMALITMELITKDR